MFERRYYTIYQCYLLLLLLMMGTIIFSGCQFKTRNQSEPNWVDVPIDMNEAKELQEQVDDGHRVGLFDPNQVAREFLAEHLGLVGDMPLEMTGDPSEGKLFRATPNKNHTAELLLVQPVRQDATGIWRVKQYRFSEGK